MKQVSKYVFNYSTLHTVTTALCETMLGDGLLYFLACTKCFMHQIFETLTSA